jgi:hypothetical protein
VSVRDRVRQVTIRDTTGQILSEIVRSIHDADLFLATPVGCARAGRRHDEESRKRGAYGRGMHGAPIAD